MEQRLDKMTEDLEYRLQKIEHSETPVAEQKQPPHPAAANKRVNKRPLLRPRLFLQHRQLLLQAASRTATEAAAGTAP